MNAIGKLARRARARRNGSPRVPSLPSPSSFDPAFHPDHLLTRQRFPEPLLFPPKTRASDLALDRDEWVIGIARNDDAIVYPAAVMGHLHIATDLVDGDPVLVTFCKNCFSAVAFDPRVEGTVLTFTAFGGHEGSLVLRDVQTGSLWSQTTGRGLAGPMTGRELRQVPVELTTLEDWLSRYPASATPDPAVCPPPRPAAPGKTLGEAWRNTVSVIDDRLPDRDLVLGVRTRDAARAYQLDVIEPGPRLYQDEMGGVPIVLLAPGNGWPLAFDRRTPDGVVEFTQQDTAIEDDKGSRWTPEGLAVDGPRQGMQLRFVASHISEWYAWAASHPHTDVVTRAQMLGEA